ncbi:ATP-binding protein [Actinoplanes sp. NPDC049802]|uniref:sensor histidine kinase n=1 Tax=Actinoplanes sp. NPDC049802 TaxID=3154742 RepID=UPI00340EC3A2
MARWDRRCGSRRRSSSSGTPDSDRDRVFDRFYRAGNVRHQGIPGSGLGLSRARTIVRLHGGEISLRQRRPSGTIVCVRLPARVPGPAPGGHPPGSAAFRRGSDGQC